MPKKHDPLAVMLKVMASPEFSKMEKRILFEWAIKKTNNGRRRKFSLRDWASLFVSNLISIISIITS